MCFTNRDKRLQRPHKHSQDQTKEADEQRQRELIEVKNKRLRRLKGNLVCGVGSVFPTDKGKANEDFQRLQLNNSRDEDALRAAAEILYKRGMQLGRQLSEGMMRRGEEDQIRSDLGDSGGR